MTPTIDRALPLAAHDGAQLIHEHHVLLRHCAEAQTRCTALLRTQAAQIEVLHAQAMRRCAALIVRDTALAWAREDRAVLEAAIPGLPRRVSLARRVDALVVRIQDLMREHPEDRHSASRGSAVAAPVPSSASTVAVGTPHASPSRGHEADNDLDDNIVALEASLAAADLVICQTGCLSQGDYWRVQDHCARTGKACVLVEQPDSLRIVRIHGAGGCAGSTSAIGLKTVRDEAAP